MRLRSFLTNTRATAGVEMALILPIISVLFLNVADATMYIYSKMQVDLAAQEAAGIARAMCDTESELPATLNCAGLTAAMTAAAQATSLGTDVSLGTPDNAWYCANATSDLLEVATIDLPRPADCSATLGGSTALPGEYISVTATYTFTPIFSSVSAVPSGDIQRTAWIRLQ